jgi:hypothetical protein
MTDAEIIAYAQAIQAAETVIMRRPIEVTIWRLPDQTAIQIGQLSLALVGGNMLSIHLGKRYLHISIRLRLFEWGRLT